MPSSPKKPAARKATAKKAAPKGTDYLKDYGRFVASRGGPRLVNKAAGRGASAAAKGASAAAKGAGRGASAAAKGVGKGASATGKGVGKGASATGKGVGKGASAAGKGVGKGASAAAKSAGRAAAWFSPFADPSNPDNANARKPAKSSHASPHRSSTKKPAKSVGGVYLADGTEYKGKNGKPSGTGRVAPTGWGGSTARVYGTKGGPGGNNTNMVPFKKAAPKATRAKPIPRATRSSKRR
jgi:hypothetical protein